MKEVETYLSYEIKKPMGIRTVDDENRKLIYFNNAKEEIWYSAPNHGAGPIAILDDGEPMWSWVEYKEKGVVSDIEERLRSYHSPINFLYARNVVCGNQDKHDPNGELWRRVVEYVKAHESRIFTDTGDFRKDIYNSEVADFIDSLACDVVEPDVKTIAAYGEYVRRACPEDINAQAKLAELSKKTIKAEYTNEIY